MAAAIWQNPVEGDSVLKAESARKRSTVTIVTFAEIAGQIGKITYQDGTVELPTGRRLHYLDYGGDGEVVVALPGYIQNAHAFDEIATALVPHVRLLALDMRGRGGSDWGPMHEYRANYYLQDLQDFLDVLGLNEIALIGTCLGGLVAFSYAMAHLPDVKRIVFNDFSLNGDPGEARYAAQRYARAPAKFATLSDAIEWFLEEHVLDALDDDALQAWVGHFLTSLPNGGFRLNCDPNLLQAARHAPLHSRQGRSPPIFMEYAKRLNMPVLILRGEESDVVSQDDARLMAKAMPAGRWMDVPGAGHSPTLYEPEAQAALREFFGIPATG